VVGYCAGQRFVADSFFDLRKQIGRIPGLKDRQLYYEYLEGGEAAR
jgi:hypothetical protein